MDAEELDLVIRGRRAMVQHRERMNAMLIAEMRNLWSTGPRWSAAQVMGEAPAPEAGVANDVGALGALEARARQARIDSEIEEASGWADSFDPPDVVCDDDDESEGA